MADNSKLVGWALCLASFLLLMFLGRLDLLVVLVPTSLVLGYGVSAGRSENGTNRRRKKGVA